MKPSKVLGMGSTATDKSFEFTADILAAIFTWGGIGWVLDRLLGTSPLLMVIGFVVGNTAGLYLLYIRTQDGESKPAGEPLPQIPTSPIDGHRQ